MRRFHEIRAAVLGLVGALLWSATALASTTVVVQRVANIDLDIVAFGATAECGFTVELHSVGRMVIISRYDGDVLVSQTVQIVSTATC